PAAGASAVGRAPGVALDLEHHLVEVAPEPVLARLEALDEGVAGGVVMGGGVAAGRAVAAPDVAARGAAPEVDPAAATGEALSTAVAARRCIPYGVEVRAGGHRRNLPAAPCRRSVRRG